LSGPSLNKGLRPDELGPAEAAYKLAAAAVRLVPDAGSNR